jgi:hypothetical protein
MTQKASGYPPIGDLGLVGDGQSVALLGPEGHVEFLCPLRRGPKGMTYPAKRMLSSAPGAVRSPLPGADGASC